VLVTTVILGTLALLAGGAAALAFQRIYDDASIPSEDELVVPDPTIVVDADGELLQTLEPAAIRENVDVHDLPDHVAAAVLAAEDRRFHEHRGFSIRGIVRAAVANLRAGEVVQGASTIHQQYVAMAVADIDDSYVGKFREAAIAARLDDEYSKDRVLEMYLNSVPFGRSAYGVQAAARTYFDVDAVDLDVEQAATLAGMIAAPSAFDPARNPEGAASRRDFALGGMVEIGALDREEAEEHLGTELPELRTDPLVTFGPDGYVLDEIRDQLPALVGDDRDDVTSGLTVRTTIDRRAQHLAHDALVEELGDAADSGSVVTIDPSDGAIRALLGGLDFETQQFNVATEGLRQVGSSFKTFAVAELVARGYDPDDSIVDAPEEVEVETDNDTVTIGNYSGDGYGELSVREALASSVNTAFVLLAEELGHDEVVDQARRLGVQQDIAPVPSSVLGTADLTALEVASAYATLNAEGTRNEPYLIASVESHDGEILHEHEPDPEEVLAADHAAIVTDVLVDVVEEGTGGAAALDRPVAGKTGTTNDFRDAWFVGSTPQLTTAVWVGNRDNAPMDGVTGGSVPAAAWATYMDALLRDVDPGTFPTPDTDGLEPFEDLDPTRDEDEPTEDGEAVQPAPAPAPSPEPDDPATEDADPDDPTEDEAPDDEAPDDEAPDDEAPEDEEPAPDEDGNGDDGEGNGDDGEGKRDDDGNGNDDDSGDSGDSESNGGDDGNNDDDDNGNDDGNGNGGDDADGNGNDDDSGDSESNGDGNGEHGGD
jgi:penicillin-binding protein 1A